MGRKEAHDYFQQFVLEQMRVPDLPHYPMNDLRKNDSFTGRRSSLFRAFSIQELADHYVGKRKLTCACIPLHLRGKDIIEPREVRNLSRPVFECPA